MRRRIYHNRFLSSFIYLRSPQNELFMRMTNSRTSLTSPWDLLKNCLARSVTDTRMYNCGMRAGSLRLTSFFQYVTETLHGLCPLHMDSVLARRERPG